VGIGKSQAIIRKISTPISLKMEGLQKVNTKHTSVKPGRAKSESILRKFFMENPGLPLFLTRPGNTGLSREEEED